MECLWSLKISPGYKERRKDGLKEGGRKGGRERGRRKVLPLAKEVLAVEGNSFFVWRGRYSQQPSP